MQLIFLSATNCLIKVICNLKRSKSSTWLEDIPWECKTCKCKHFWGATPCTPAVHAWSKSYSIIHNWGTLLIPASLKDPAPYLHPLFITFNNFRVASNLRSSFFQTFECSNCIQTQIIIMSYVLLFLLDVSTSLHRNRHVNEWRCLLYYIHVYVLFPLLNLSPPIIILGNMLDPLLTVTSHVLWALELNVCRV